MTNSAPAKFPTMEEIVAQNPHIDLCSFREWQRIKTELENAGIDTGRRRDDPKPQQQQPTPLSALGL